MTYSLRLTALADKVTVTSMGIWVGWARVHQVTRVGTWLEKTNSNVLSTKSQVIMTRVFSFLVLPQFTQQHRHPSSGANHPLSLRLVQTADM